MSDNPQFQATRELVDAILDPKNRPLIQAQRETIAKLDELRTRYDALSTNHLKAVEALKIVNNALRRLCELNQFGIPGMGELREALSDLLDELA